MSRLFDIREFGAVGDGKFDCTAAIQQAIDRCSEAGGGTVLIDQPHGTGTRITLTLAIRQGQSEVHSGLLYPDYSGEMDHALIELSDCLPSSLYEKEI